MSINWKNTALVVFIGLLFLFKSYLDPTLSGILIGMISVYLGMKIKEFGMKETFTKDPRKANNVFRFIKDGNLEELKRVAKAMDKRDFLSLKPYGGYTMLIFAATYGHLDILKYLVELGADVNEASDNGETPLLRACHFNRIDLLAYLISKGANLDHRSR